MISESTLKRLRWHAGLDNFSPDDASVAACTGRWRQNDRLEEAFDNLLTAMEDLNHEVNGPAPSDLASPHLSALPRGLVYAATEIERMLREHDGRLAGRFHTAWNAVLSGDIDDLRQLIRDDEMMRT